MANQISFSKRMAMAQEIVNKLNQKEEAENVKIELENKTEE